MLKAFIVIQLAACFLVIYSTPCNKLRSMSSNFCNYLKSDNWKGLKKEVNAYLNTIKPEDGPEINFNKIKDWLSAQECVTNVKVEAVEISTYPPIKEITVTLNDNGGSITKTIGIRFSKTKYEINIQ